MFSFSYPSPAKRGEGWRARGAAGGGGAAARRAPWGGGGGFTASLLLGAEQSPTRPPSLRSGGRPPPQAGEVWRGTSDVGSPDGKRKMNRHAPHARHGAGAPGRAARDA